MENEIDYNKLIFSKHCNGLYVLLPSTEERGYRIVGYNWFSLKNHSWNSCCCWKTKEEAVAAYGEGNCFNGELGLFLQTIK